ncbi:MAG: Cof-type HAD-IIB family hydrolase [Defluviitaleaceae bacterium]|nr:Cof-type HAD-IIB family hydrolase [Defluviitaleaceae bacterium]
MYKLIACDMDGTLLDDSFTLSQIDKDAITKARDAGIIFTLCSGRSYKSLRVFAQELGIITRGSYIIGFNGGIIYDPYDGVVVRKDDLPKDVAVEIVKLYKAAALDMEIVIYLDGERVLFEKNAVYAHKYQRISNVDWLETTDIVSAARELESIAKIIFIGENSTLKTFEKELEDAFGRDVGICFSAEYLLEAGPKGRSKGDGIMWLCQKLGINPAEVIAIGDNYNDISMIKQAGLGVAVANAVDAAKEVADYVTARDCSNGAVAEVIEKFVLQQNFL